MENPEEIKEGAAGVLGDKATETSVDPYTQVLKKRRRRRWLPRKKRLEPKTSNETKGSDNVIDEAVLMVAQADLNRSHSEEQPIASDQATQSFQPAPAEQAPTNQTGRQPIVHDSKRKRRRHKKVRQDGKEVTVTEKERPRRDTTKRILINASYPSESRVAIVEGNRLIDFYVETTSRQQLKGNIYKGVVVSVLPSLQAAFVDFGQKRHGFLQLKEIMPELYQDKQDGKKSIQKAVIKGQEILVQVEKDEHDTKGASLTTYISLPGRYIVMMPGQQRIGISRKIENRQDREHLREIFNSLKLPKNMGFILRTACSDSIEQELNQDLKYLLKLWQRIKTDADRAKAPALIYKEQDIALRTVRDYLTTDVAEILIDQKETFSAVKSYLKKIIPGRDFNVAHYKERQGLFSLYNLESQIAALNEPYVNLPSRGYLVFGKTEALTAIDVNSGRGKKEDNLETTVLNTNLEAVEEIARQIRLRDIGGLIVIDFIDMQSQKNRRLIEQKMADALSSDKANTELAPLSKFCILEMTRERLRPSYAETTSVKCPICNGKGIVRSDNSTALSAFRDLHYRAAEGKSDNLTCRISIEGAKILLNDMREELLEIEKSFSVRLVVVPDRDMPHGQYVIEG